MKNEIAQYDKIVLRQLYKRHGHKKFSKFDEFESFRSRTILGVINKAKLLNIIIETGSTENHVEFHPKYENKKLPKIISGKIKLNDIFENLPKDITEQKNEPLKTDIQQNLKDELSMLKDRQDRLEKLVSIMDWFKDNLSQDEALQVMDYLNNLDYSH